MIRNLTTRFGTVYIGQSKDGFETVTEIIDLNVDNPHASLFKIIYSDGSWAHIRAVEYKVSYKELKK